MSRLRELMAELCPDGVEYRKLGEVCEILDSQRKPVTKKDRTTGQYPYYGANGIQDYVDEFIFDGTFLLVGEDGSVVTEHGSPVVHWATGKIWVNNHAHILKEKEGLRLRFLFHYLQTVNIRHLVKGVPPKLNQKNLREIFIPVPPLPIQNEIVKLLDNFTELTAELTAELALRKKQYNFYRDSLLKDTNRTVSVKKLGDIGSVCMCKRILKQQTNTESGVPFYKIGTFGKNADSYISKELFLEYKEKYSYPRKGEILISAAGTIGRSVVYDGTPAYFQDSNIVWIANDESLVLNRYLYYFYSLFPWRVADGGTIARLYNDQIRQTEIPVPPLEVQQKIVSILDRFDTLCNDLTQGLPAEIAARKKQYEYYRDKLLTFPRKAV